MQPEMFAIPTYEELVEIYKTYAKQKNLLIHETIQNVWYM